MANKIQIILNGKIIGEAEEVSIETNPKEFVKQSIGWGISRRGFGTDSTIKGREKEFNLKKLRPKR